VREVIGEFDPRQPHAPVGVRLRAEAFRPVQETDGHVELVAQSFVQVADRCAALGAERPDDAFGFREALRLPPGQTELVFPGTVKLMLVTAEKRRSSSALRAHAAAMAPVTSAQIAKACVRALRYSVPVT
jgi:hypothetical protein